MPGTAIFLTSDVEMAPVALMHNLKHNKVLHEKNLIATVRIAETPRVPESKRIELVPINDVFKQLVINYGFMERPNLPKALALCRKQGVKFDIMATSLLPRPPLGGAGGADGHAHVAGQALHLPAEKLR